MKIILKESKSELEIKKSKFISHVKPISSEEEAKEFIKEISKEHRKATHNVPVYLLGKNYKIQKYSDDGEPSGTAGLPVLRMLMNEGVSNLVIVITRYFGGIKLGKGGLLRAYTSSAKLGLEKSGLSEVYDFIKVGFELDYSIQSKFLHELETNFVYYDDKIEYVDLIKFSYYIHEKDIMAFEKFMIDMTLGNFVFKSKSKVKGILLDGKVKEVRSNE